MSETSSDMSTKSKSRVFLVGREVVIPVPSGSMPGLIDERRGAGGFTISGMDYVATLMEVGIMERRREENEKVGVEIGTVIAP